MASPDERQGDKTATTTCYFCHEIPDYGGVSSGEGIVAAAKNLPVRPTEKGIASVAGEQEGAPRMGIGGDAVGDDARSTEMGER